MAQTFGGQIASQMGVGGALGAQLASSENKAVIAGRTHFADEPWDPAGKPGETTHNELESQLPDA